MRRSPESALTPGLLLHRHLLGNSKGPVSVSDTPNFGQLDAARPDYAASDETPLRIAVWGDFSGRAGREGPRGADELKSLRPRKAAFDDLDELIEELGPKLAFSTSGGDEIELEFTELDDFHPDPIYKQADVFNRLEDSREDRVGSPAALQMRELLRHPIYQALESTWRGLAFLLRRVSKDRRVQVVIYDVTAEELRNDLASRDDLAQTAIHDLLVTKSAQTPDGMPWGMILGLYTFDLTEDDAALLGKLAKIAVHAGGPFLAAIGADVTCRDSYELPSELESAWTALRAVPETSYLALATPGFLLRPPFGDNYRPPDAIPFEEFDGRPEGYLWGHSAVACATLLALGFMESGWGMNPAVKRTLDNMPIHAYRDEHDEEVGVATEVRFASPVGVELAKLGLIPVLSFKGRDLIELATVRSVSATQPLLGGLWTGGGKVTFASPAEVTPEVHLQGGPAPKSAKVKSDDPEVDDDLASLLAGGADDDADTSRDDGDSRSDDDSSADSEVESSADASDETTSTDDDATDASEQNDDLDLDALMASLGDDDESTAREASNSTDAEPSTEEAKESSDGSGDDDLDLDALLAGLGGDEESPASTDAEVTTSREEAASESSSDDDDLAALLAGGDDASSSDDDQDASPAGSGDADLDAILAGLGGSDDHTDGDADSDSGDSDSGESSDDDLSALLDDEPKDETTDEASTDDETASDDDLHLEALMASLGDDEVSTETATSDTEEAKTSAQEEEGDLDLDAMLAGLDDGDSTSAEEETNVAGTTSDDTETADDDSAGRGAGMETQDLDAEVAATKAATKYGASAIGTPPILDFLALVRPISEDEPAGDSVPFDVRQNLDEMRKEVNPADFADDDPLRPEEPIRADWPGVIRLCQDTLANKSKNLLIAARLTEALSKVHGFAGLRDGLHLFRQLAASCWNRLEPALDEDDDLEVRAAPFNWLDDTDRGAVFPNTVRSLPVVVAGNARYGALHWQLAREGKQDMSTELVEQTVINAAPEQCRKLADDAAQALAEIKQLTNELRMKMGGEAPGLSYVRAAIEEGATLAKQIVARKGGDEAPAEAAESVADASGGQTVVVRQGPKAVTRDDLYKQLNEAAAALQRMEPHSPVPYIVQRAVALGALPFPQLMLELIRDANVITEMNRELGIKPPPSED